MESTIYNAMTNTYKVTNDDGTFDTYTPAQYESKFGILPSVEEDVADVTTDIDPLDTVVPTDEVAPTEELVLTSYKILQPIPFTDELGNEMGMTEVGSVQVVPKELGDEWVEAGLAELVVLTEPVQSHSGSVLGKLNPFKQN